MAPNTSGVAALLNATTDIDPYAYPYFHAGCDAPLVFELINKFGSIIASQNDNSNNNREDTAHTMNSSTISSMSGSQPSQARLERLARKIQSRCISKPEEVCWKDSCGDTALHRLCQIARYPPPEDTKSGEDPVMMCCSDLLTQIARSLIAAYPAGVGALNKWNETPLHQFVAHCGIYGNTNKEENVMSFSMSMELVKLLSLGHTASYRNYVGSYPLHDACELSQGYAADSTDIDFFHENNNNATDFSNVSQQHQQQTGGDLDNTMPSPSSIREGRKNSSNEEEIMKVQHLSIVKHLVRCHPEALFEKDNSGFTPLHRAVASWKCNVDIVVFLLEQMEKYCNDEDDSATTRTLRVKPFFATQSTTAMMGGRGTGTYTSSFSLYGNHHLRSFVLPPLQLLWEQICSCHEPGRPDKTISNIILSTLSDQQSDPHKLVVRLGPLWDKIIVLLKAATYGTVPVSDKNDNNTSKNNSFLLVHATIAFACPLSIIALAIRLHPEQLLISDEEFGMTPLLIASSSLGILLNGRQQNGEEQNHHTPTPKTHMNQEDFGFQHLAAEFWWPEQHRQMALKLFNMVLQLNPMAAQIIDLQTKRLPFHVAISTSGFYWEECLKSLFEVEPRALVTRDPVTHLYPFALAALSNENTTAPATSATKMKSKSTEKLNPYFTSTSDTTTTTNQSIYDKDDIEKLSTIFSLLREDPSMLSLSM